MQPKVCNNAQEHFVLGMLHRVHSFGGQIFPKRFNDTGQRAQQGTECRPGFFVSDDLSSPRAHAFCSQRCEMEPVLKRRVNTIREHTSKRL
jgi:hypothetical protein